MKKYLLSSLFLLSIVVSAFAITATANAATLHNYASDRCLAVAGVAPKNQQSGTALVIWDCDGTPGQQWGYNSSGAPFPGPPSNGSSLGWYLVSSVTSNRYLTTSPAPCNVQLCGTSSYAGNGSAVFVSTWTGARFQQWEMSWQGRDFRSHDCYSIESRADEDSFGLTTTPTVLGVANGNKSNGGQVIMWQQLFDKNGGPDFVNHGDQYWCVYN